MIVIRSCCENVLPNVRKDLLGRILIYCPHCGYSVVGATYDEALENWNDCQNGVVKND